MIGDEELKTAPIQIDMPQNETVEERAVRLLRQLLPSIRTRDQAIENLFYCTPEATPELKLWTIAAAVFILSKPR